MSTISGMILAAGEEEMVTMLIVLNAVGLRETQLYCRTAVTHSQALEIRRTTHQIERSWRPGCDGVPVTIQGTIGDDVIHIQRSR